MALQLADRLRAWQLTESLNTVASRLEPVDVVPAARCAWGEVRGRWECLEVGPAVSTPIGASRGTDRMASVVTTLGAAIHETKLDCDRVDVRDISAITESKSPLWKYSSVEELGAQYWEELPADSDRVAKCVRHLTSPWPLTLCSSDWDGRTRWRNDGGSHHMAALIWHMRRVGEAHFMRAERWLTVRNVAALLRLDAEYALYAVAEAAAVPIVHTCSAAGLAVDLGELCAVIMNQGTIDEHDGAGDPAPRSLHLVGFPRSGSPLALAAAKWLTSIAEQGRAVCLVRHIAELPVVVGFTT